MNVQRVTRLRLAAALAILSGWWGVSAAVAAPPLLEEAGEGVEVLTRGPVHEAFAATLTYDPEPGLIVPQAPPEPIEELPPEQRPAGDDVEWIPGYWAWDDDRTDFLWVSGLWRNLPPGREWVPGYWATSRHGSQWTSGYWADATLTEQEYLPEPPATAEAGPNIAQPSADHYWLPGCWMWHQNRYAWRPGFWVAGQQDWEWIPAHYQWTPRGYVYIEGYYDYPVDNRGILFSPVYFHQSVYSRPGFSYSPSLAVNLAGAMNHLFLRPSYGHYYFGDYYSSSYSTAGFYPWFSYSSSGYGYDPIFTQRRWQNRRDRDWTRRLEEDYSHRRDHDDARPPRTWRAQQELSKGDSSRENSFFVATPYDEVLKREDSRKRFQPVDAAERQKFVERGREVQKFRVERQKIEADAEVVPNSPRTNEGQPVRGKRPRSPIAGKPAEQLGSDRALPQRHQPPQLDPRIEPQPRQSRGRPVVSGNPNVIRPPQGPAGRPQVERKPQGQPDPQAQPKRAEAGKPRGESPGKPRGASQQKPQEKPQQKATPKAEEKPRGKPSKK